MLLLRGMEEVLEDLRPLVQLTPTPCLSRCGRGSILIAYPEGVVYGGVAQEDFLPFRWVHLEGGEVYEKRLLEVI